MGAKLRHVAMAVADPERTAAFYIDVFGMEKVGESHTRIADGVYLSDGTINLALLRFKSAETLGEGKTTDFQGVHHVGFWVDDAEGMREKIEEAGGRWYRGELGSADTYYEVKFYDPDGAVFDVTHSGWVGARKDGADEG